MPSEKELKILVVNPSMTESSTLMVLLSPLTRDITICSKYNQGVTILQYIIEHLSPFDLIFLSLPPDNDPDIDVAVKLLALAMSQSNDPHRTVILGGNNLPPSLKEDLDTSGTILYKPITREKLQQALAPLALTLPRLNCWEYMHCGREQGGINSAELGICPVTEALAVQGLHGGQGGGRVCWAIGGTLCGGKVQGSFACKVENCLECNFYQLVKIEEGDKFSSIDSVLARLRRGTIKP